MVSRHKYIRPAVFPTLGRVVARAQCLEPVGYPFREHTAILFAGTGVVHVLTDVGADGSLYACTDVTIARYRNGVLHQHLPLAGSVSCGSLARVMHEHWCDRDRLGRLLEGDNDTQCVLDIDWEIDDDEETRTGDDGQDVDISEFPRVQKIWSYAMDRFVRTDDAIAALRPRDR